MELRARIRPLSRRAAIDGRVGRPDRRRRWRGRRADANAEAKKVKAPVVASVRRRWTSPSARRSRSAASTSAPASRRPPSCSSATARAPCSPRRRSAPRRCCGSRSRPRSRSSCASRGQPVADPVPPPRARQELRQEVHDPQAVPDRPRAAPAPEARWPTADGRLRRRRHEERRRRPDDDDDLLADDLETRDRHRPLQGRHGRRRRRGRLRVPVGHGPQRRRGPGPNTVAALPRQAAVPEPALRRRRQGLRRRLADARRGARALALH